MWGQSRRVIGLVILSGILVAGVEAADRSARQDGTDRVDELLVRYNLHPAFEKFGRGVGNTLAGWMEIPLNIHKHYTPADAATSFFTGAALGVAKGFVRTGVGLYEMLTFWLPYPEDYAPILPTLEYFQRDHPHRAPLPLE